MSNDSYTDLPAPKPPGIPRAVIFGGAALAAGAAAYFALGGAVDEGARRMAALFVTALVLWVTEAVPLFATALIVITGGVWLLNVVPGLDAPVPTEVFFGAVSNPIIFVMLGGFALAQAVQKEGIDKQMAALLLRPFGTHPYAVLAGLIAVTAAFSMWMSNTATTAMMIALLAPLLRAAGDNRRLRSALTLAVPFAANIGGLGTPIGTPPNALGMAQLAAGGYGVSFVGWMILAVPLMLGGLVLLWGLLLVFFRPSPHRLPEWVSEPFELTRNAAIVYGSFGVTVLLWVFGEPFGVPVSVASVVPVAALTASGVLTREDFNRLDWSVLFLIAGGIALGNGIHATALDAWAVAQIPVASMSPWMIAATGCLAVVAMSTVISHTVASNILLPVVIAVGASVDGGEHTPVFVIMVAMGASFGMCLPISTPPNVIAYGTGEISARDMLRVGAAISGIAAAVMIVTGPAFLHLLLRLL